MKGKLCKKEGRGRKEERKDRRKEGSKEARKEARKEGKKEREEAPDRSTMHQCWTLSQERRGAREESFLIHTHVVGPHNAPGLLV